LPASGTQGQSEFPACVQVTATLNKAPKLGQTATLNVDLLAAISGKSHVTLELPAGLTFSSLPTGFTASVVSGDQTDGTVATRASGTVQLTKGNHTTLQAIVLANATGHGQLQAAATGPRGTPGGLDAAFVTVGTTAGKSFLGIDVPPQIKLKAAPAGIAPVPTAMFPYRPAGDPAGGPPAGGVHPFAGVACATGAFVYQDQDGNWHPVPNLWVRARNANTFGDSTVASTLTAADGTFSLCFTNDDPNFGESGTVDLYLLARTETSMWNARDDTTTNTFEYKTTKMSDIPDGTTAFGNLTSKDATFMRPLHIVDEFNNAWGAVPGPCWDQIGSCDQKTIAWSPTSTQWPHMSRVISDGVVFLPAMGPDFQPVVEHELGHAMMLDVYDHNWPPENCPNPHFLWSVEDTGCAWTEGFASWFALHVDQDGWLAGWVPGKPNTVGETATWGDGGSYGVGVEGRVTTALWDLEDSTDEPPWDRKNGLFAEIWSTFQNHNSPDLAGFWADRNSDGFDTTSLNAEATLYQNTIDLGGVFTDQLPFHMPVQRPDPPTTPLPLPPGTSNDHNWHTQPPFGGHETWFVDAVRPNGTLALRLRDFTDAGQTVLDGDSNSGVAGRIEWIAHPLPPTDLWPKVSTVSGTGGYTIETDQTASVLSDPGADTIPGNVDRPDIVAIRQVSLTAGQLVDINVVPTGPRAGITDPELFVVNGASTVVRSGATWSSSTHGTGGHEEVTFVAPTTGVYGIIVTTKAGSSAYALSVS
jgi:hypothetical protein